MASPLENIEYLARSSHRTGVLGALADGRRERHELCEATGASSPTIGRVLSAFNERQWIVRDGSAYALTPLGEYVAEQFDDLHDAMETEQKLRDVWQWLPREMSGFSVDLFADAIVSYPGPEYPYRPVERVCDLIEETNSLQGFGTTVYKSVNNETVCDCVLAGMDYEYIYSPEILEVTISWNPQRLAEAAACDNCNVLLHDDLPDRDRCGLGIFDDRIGICCHDAETGMLEAFVDTSDPDARKWALSVYERHRAEARPITEAEKAEFFPEGLAV